MDDLLQQGITAYKAGKRDEARNIFITVVSKGQIANPLGLGCMMLQTMTKSEFIALNK